MLKSVLAVNLSESTEVAMLKNVLAVNLSESIEVVR